MIKHSLRIRVLLSFLFVIFVLGVVSALFGYNIIKSNIIKRAQDQVKNDLNAARAVYNDEISQMEKSFDLIPAIDNPAHLKSQLGLDYLFCVCRDKQDSVKSDIVRRAFMGNGNGGTRTIDSAELRTMGDDLFTRARIELKKTPMARPTEKTVLTSALAMEYAVPYYDANGVVVRVIYGGKIVNRYFNFIDKVHDIVYDSKLYYSKPLGTVTIFKDDVRIATNVLDKDGRRAIGTRMSATVYDNVVCKGKPWLDRAFVVTDWYLTAYEPIRDVNGAIAGVFYVGILERPFTDLIRSTLMSYLIIIGIAGVFAGIVAFLLAGGIAKPLTRFATATENLAAGDLTHRVQPTSPILELNRLALSFNVMAENLHEREMSLTAKNDELAILNARYLDLVGMVSHELKGILASAVLNACSVRDGYLGDLTVSQKKALDSVVRNLEYFDMTVKNFLNLSRIEKNELDLSVQNVFLKEDVVDVAIDAFARQALEKNMAIENNVPFECTLDADGLLLLMVMNNLVGNAIKYGTKGGCISISSAEAGQTVTVTVYNTGRPLTQQETEKLFKRFSRLESSPEAKKARGTGLGLFLCKTIVERHGGTIRCEPDQTGNNFIFIIPHSQADRQTALPASATTKENTYA